MTKPATLEVRMVRDAKVYVNDEGIEIHRLGYATILLLYGMSLLKPGESMPEGIFSATGEGKIPGMRTRLFGDSIMLGYVERVLDARRTQDRNVAPVRLTPEGLHAAEYHELVGPKPPSPLSILKARMKRMIEAQREEPIRRAA